jgi:hypothetical protein
MDLVHCSADWIKFYPKIQVSVLHRMASTIYFVPATVENISLRVVREKMDADTKVATTSCCFRTRKAGHQACNENDIHLIVRAMVNAALSGRAKA